MAYFKLGEIGQPLIDKFNNLYNWVIAKAAASHVHNGGDPVVVERHAVPSSTGNVIINIDPTNKLARVIDTDGSVLGVLVDEKRAALAAHTGALIALPGSGQSNGQPLGLTTSYQTLHQANPDAGYGCLYEFMGATTATTSQISLSLDGGTTTHGYTEVEEENGAYTQARGLMDPASATNLQLKHETGQTSNAWANIQWVPLSTGGDDPGFVLPSGASGSGFVLPTTTGVTIHQCGASAGYADVVDLYAITRTANDVVITLNDGAKDFVKRTQPGASWQEILSGHTLTGNTTLTAKADVNGRATVMAVIKRLPTS
jgi:hypothetical protein